jgi:Rieske Fe-S protein
MPGETTRRALFSKAALTGAVAFLAQTVAWVRPAAAAETDESAADAAAPVLATTKSIPLRGGKIFKSKHVVVTHPKKGVFHAFSSTCTHQGCTVATVKNGTINCPCHGSKYNISTGAVVAGPAPRALPKRKIKISKGKIRLG